MKREMSDRWNGRHRRFGLRVLQLYDADGNVFLTRWRLFNGPRLGLYLHRIAGPDPGIDLHDHPWRLWSFVLWGGYIEEVAAAREAPLYAALAERWPDTCTHGVRRCRRRWSFGRIRPEQAHRIVHVAPRTWTLALVGSKYRDWGFFLPDGWQSWTNYDYTARRPSTEVR